MKEYEEIQEARKRRPGHAFCEEAAKPKEIVLPEIKFPEIEFPPFPEIPEPPKVNGIKYATYAILGIQIACIIFYFASPYIGA